MNPYTPLYSQADGSTCAFWITIGDSSILFFFFLFNIHTLQENKYIAAQLVAFLGQTPQSFTTSVAFSRKTPVPFGVFAPSDGSVNADELDNQVMVDVFGPERYGRVRGKGAFVTPTKYFGTSSSHYMPSQSQSVKAEMSQFKQQLTEQMDHKLEEKIAQLQAIADAKDAEREAAYQRRYQELQDQMKNIMNIIQPNPPQSPPSP
ncbi:hypothetical protein GQ457_05G032870 [Hibiscus cannabinus]